MANKGFNKALRKGWVCDKVVQVTSMVSGNVSASEIYHGWEKVTVSARS